ncbi:hypothetical protein [Bifidobacterium callitrichidarum]|uniref:hypothetical protein n=1 Tax=Bifidobacterium callitrichidarum TaxID=2052941 RepID=UPI001304BD04|nr:hypothetical protein [Bifidobacterium callitrichidarum]
MGYFTRAAANSGLYYKPCAVSSIGNVFQFDNGATGEIKKSSENADACYTDPNILNSREITFHSARWSGLIYEKEALSIDETGQLWVMPIRDGSTTHNLVAEPIMSDVTFTTASSGPNNREYGVLLLGKPKNTQAAYQAQMPTTGAPTGLTQVGLASAVICLLGIGFLFRRNLSI